MRRTIFDTKLVKTLINIGSIFPLGSLVKLNNNEIGRVTGTSHLHPTRPKVEILLDSRARLQIAAPANDTGGGADGLYRQPGHRRGRPQKITIPKDVHLCLVSFLTR